MPGNAYKRSRGISLYKDQYLVFDGGYEVPDANAAATEKAEIESQVIEYLQYALYAACNRYRHLYGIENITVSSIQDNAILIGDLPVSPGSVTVQVDSIRKHGDVVNEVWEGDGGKDPVSLTTLAKDTSFLADPDMQTKVLSVFGDTVLEYYDSILTGNPDGVSNEELSDDERAELLFLYALDLTGQAATDPNIAQCMVSALKSEETKKSERMSAAQELIDVPVRTSSTAFEIARWIGYNWSNVSSFWNTGMQADTEAAAVKELASMRNIDHDDIVNKQGGFAKLTTPAQYYAWIAYGQPVDFSHAVEPREGAISCPFTASEIAASLETLKSMQDAPGSQLSGSINAVAGRWVDRYKVAVGVACGIVDASNLKYIEHNEPTIVSILPPSWVLEDESKVNKYGFAMMVYVLQDLIAIAYDEVNKLGPFMDSTAPSFSGYEDWVLGMRALYTCFNTVNDKYMWQVWNTTKIDFRSGAEKQSTSLGMLYDFLQANDAFSILADYNVDSTQPFAYFFNTKSTERELSQYIKDGVILSSQFIPMHTNVYSPYTWTQSTATPEWLLNFYVKFGYYRKALYIDTNPDAAVNYANTRGRGTLRVATLNDMLQDKDIVLYIDENLYNVNHVAELIGDSWDRMGQSSESSTLGTWDSFTEAVTNLWSVSMSELAKTAERKTYSTRVSVQEGNKWDQYFLPIGGAEWEDRGEDSTSVAAIGDTDTIAKYLYADNIVDPEKGVLYQDYEQVEYSHLEGFAVLSGIYRDPNNLRNTLNSIYSSNTPVFLASDTAPFVDDALRTSIYNWLLVRNIESQMTIDYQSSLDTESPLYMDVFGNILTESGYVVVPAAANATLFSAKDYKPYNAGLCTIYGSSYSLPYDDIDSAKTVNKMLESCFAVDEETGVWALRNVMTVDGSVNLAKLSIGAKDSLQSLADTFAYSMQSKNFYNINTWMMLITEVLRGAPIEYIDKQFEGIQTNTAYTRQGMAVADKLETLVNALSSAGQNAALAIPNPAYIDGIEIIVFFLYKLLILAVLVIWMVTIYVDATGGQFGLRTGAKCIGAVLMVLALVVGVPKIFEITYYESNKYMLQNETEYLMMLNLEKQANGEEIGVSSVSSPQTNTKLYLHLSDVQMPWWDLLTSISTSAGYKSLDAMYRDYEGQHPLAYSESATTINGKVYIDTDTLFDGARVAFSPYLNTLYVSASSSTPASYYTPYYFFLQQITQEVSVWSKQNNFIAYTTKVQRGGQLRTLGYCKAFFESEDFIEEGNDFFNLYALYGVMAPREYPYLPLLAEQEGGDFDNIETVSELDLLRNSQWCAYNMGSEKSTQQRIEKINQFAQEWVADNRAMIGKVSDETFLKCFALACAMEHNRVFNTQRADYLEIQELSNEDLLRLSIADHNDVMSSSTMSFARFTYTMGGTMAVYLAAILELINFIGAWVKPICTLLVFLIACISIFVMKLILRRSNNSIYGYIVTVLLMCSVNFIGAITTKLSMYIPRFGFTTSVNILILILVQVVYIFVQLKIVSVAVKDWRNVGFQRQQSAFNNINIFGARDRNMSRDVSTPRMENGWEYLNRLNNRQLNRRRRA